MNTCSCCNGLIPENWLDLKHLTTNECDGSVDDKGRCRAWSDDTLWQQEPAVSSKQE